MQRVGVQLTALVLLLAQPLGAPAARPALGPRDPFVFFLPQTELAFLPGNQRARDHKEGHQDQLSLAHRLPLQERSAWLPGAWHPQSGGVMGWSRPWPGSNATRQEKLPVP